MLFFHRVHFQWYRIYRGQRMSSIHCSTQTHTGRLKCEKNSKLAKQEFACRVAYTIRKLCAAYYRQPSLVPLMCSCGSAASTAFYIRFHVPLFVHKYTNTHTNRERESHQSLCLHVFRHPFFAKQFVRSFVRSCIQTYSSVTLSISLNIFFFCTIAKSSKYFNTICHSLLVAMIVTSVLVWITVVVIAHDKENEKAGKKRFDTCTHCYNHSTLRYRP